MHYVPGSNIVAYALTGTLLLVAVVNRLAAGGTIRRNGFVGIRIPPTLASDDAWLAGHRAAELPAWLGFSLTAFSLLAAEFASWGGILTIGLFVLTLALMLVSAWRAGETTQ